MNDFAREQTAARLGVLAEALKDSAVQPEEVHAVRVASRRFLQCLKVFAGRMDPEAARKVRKRVHKLLDRCAGVRDRDIALRLLNKAGIGKSTRASRELCMQRRAATEKLELELERWHKRDIVGSWPERLFLRQAAGSSAEPDFAALTTAFFDEGHAATAPGAGYHQMHQFRLRVKNYRYALELFLDSFEQNAIEPVLAAVRKLQTLLGEMNDCVAALELLRGHTRAKRAVHEILVEREQAFCAHWKRTFGTRRRNQWTSIFSATARRNSAPPPSRKQPGRSQPKAVKTSAA